MLDWITMVLSQLVCLHYKRINKSEIKKEICLLRGKNKFFFGGKTHFRSFMILFELRLFTRT